MTSSVLDVPPAWPKLTGRQEPVIRSVPAYVSTSGPEVVELAGQAGLVLDPWQALAMNDALGERADGSWAAFEVAMIVARQNGKGGFFEARTLGGLFLLGEQLIMYSAHEFKTAQEMFRRIEGLIAGTPSMARRVLRVTRSHGDEGIELVTGQRLRFLARSTGSGRGFSGDCNIWDESQHLSDASVDAQMPTMSARPNPQLLYGGSAPDKDMAPCEQIARVRRRALAGIESGVPDPSLAYLEWSADLCTDHCPAICEDHDDPGDPQVWAKTNPGLGHRISVEHVAREHVSMSRKGFNRERLSVGNWPTEGATWEVVSEQAWRAITDPGSTPVDPVAIAADITPDRGYGSIAIAGQREDGLSHVESIDHRRGTTWMVERICELAETWKPCAIVIDAGGPAGSLIADLEAEGLEIKKPSAREAGQACGAFYDAIVRPEDAEPDWRATLRHRDEVELNTALAGAQKRKLGDAWAWARQGLSVDISPLVAVTLAMWGYQTRERTPPPATASVAKPDTSNLWRPSQRLKL